MSVIVGAFRLSPEFFIRKRLRYQCHTRGCNGDCCTEGVSITLPEVARIKEHADALQSYLIEPYDFDSWNLERPADLSTPLLNENKPGEQCWFLRHNRLCAIHSYTLDQGMPVAALKPYFCRFFPLTLIDIDINVSEIAVDGKAYDTCLVPSESETWLYKELEPELRRVIGDANFAELEKRYPDP
jgi:hypothetical protein